MQGMRWPQSLLGSQLDDIEEAGQRIGCFCANYPGSVCCLTCSFSMEQDPSVGLSILMFCVWVVMKLSIRN